MTETAAPAANAEDDCRTRGSFTGSGGCADDPLPILPLRRMPRMRMGRKGSKQARNRPRSDEHPAPHVSRRTNPNQPAKGAKVSDPTATECRCGRPTRDAAYVCDDCTTALTTALGDVPSLDTELETTITRQKAATYNGTTAKGSETPSPVHWGAAEARRNLKAVLVSWVKYCAEENVRHASPHRGLPADDLTAISRWLMWRVDGLALLDIGPDAVDEITEAVGNDGRDGRPLTGCFRVIDRPADQQYLGRCDICDDGRYYARPGGQWATCDTCEAKTEADKIRDRLLSELDDRLCTAAEIAHLSTYLGLRANREQVRKRINQWHARKRIEHEHAFAPDPVFKFGIVWRLLQQEDEVRAG